MIRHSSSFFISLVLHLTLFFVVFSGYKHFTSHTKEVSKVEKRIQIQLCNVKIKKEQETAKKTQAKVIKKVQASKRIKPISKIKTPKKIKKIIPIEVAQKEKKIIYKKQDIKKEILVSKKHIPKSTPIQLEKKYLDKHIQKIKQLLSENLYYPLSARKRNITGTVLISFTLSRTGKIHDLTIIQSKSSILSRAAKQTIENLNGLFPKPKEKLKLTIPILYKLRR